MPEFTTTKLSSTQQKLDRQLLLSLMLSPLAAGISTIVGFIVAHWITITAYKRTGYIVSAICFALCALAALLSWDGRRKLARPDKTLPQDGRQFFMVQLALLLSGLCALVVLAGTLVLITLRPND
jgi:heme A synthase